MTKPFRLTAPRQSPEANIQRAILAYLGRTLPHGFLIHHSPNGGMSKGENGRNRGLGTKPGWPDLQIVGRTADGEPFTAYLEVKAPRGQTSPEQIVIHDRLKECGYPVAVVRSITDAREAVRSWPVASRDAAIRTGGAA
ncbi:VRR-NUC domain-containing protein [Methylorubrum suomiense]|uniref:VRR-NUC domain-containing protein n=1 Tax=Methylorubrum suomiense TaxID=144191 RepID=A0ABQ4UXZ3_9HYPH|nr:VRR-NUC domain-containing protein [Methylorubrum suomiense]GJE77221.1 hypothetical protein BGCPKDLD_3824 [Methylorubrum suomiense]